MSAAAIRGVVRRLGSPADAPTDSDLVAAFAARRDPDSFAALVERHGPTVLGVCRRVLGHVHDAEDAFQAVFLVLALKAKTVRPPGAVGGWLYGVAVRTANKAKVAAARRRRREMIAATAQANRGYEPPGSSPETTELQAALDAELAQLPETHRAAVVLCDLHGKTRAEAASELGCPEGTVAARLHRARKKLADALARRGLALPAAGLTTVLAPAIVPAAAIRSALAVVQGSAPPVVLALAREVTRSMTATKSVLAFGVLSLVAGGLLAAGSMMSAPVADPPAQPPPTEAKVTASSEEKPASPWREAKVLEPDGWLAGSVIYSADGKTLYVGGTSGSGHVRAYDVATWKELWDYTGDGQLGVIALSPDGKQLGVTVKDGVRFLDATTGKAGDLLEEKGSEPLAVGWFSDTPIFDNMGQLLATSRKVIFANARGQFVKTWLEWPKVSTITTSTVPPGQKPTDEFAVPLAVSPDGQYAIVTGPMNRDTGKNGLWAWSAGAGAENKTLEGHKATVTSAAWSKDGKTIVTGDAEGIVITWDAATFKEKSRRRFGPRVAAVAISSDGKYTAAAVASLMPAPNGRGDYTEEVFVWEADAEPLGKIMRRLRDNVVEINLGSKQEIKPGAKFHILPADYPEKGRSSRLRSVHVSDGKGGYRTVERFVEKATIEVTEVLGPNLSRARITREADPIRDGAKADDLLYGEADLPTDGFKPLFRKDAGGPFKGVASLAFAPDGKSLAVAFANFDHLTKLGELRGRVRVFTLAEEPKPEPPADYVSHVEFSPDGKHYLVVSGKGIRVHDAANGKQLWDVPGEAARFAPNGESVLVMGEKIIYRHTENGVAAPGTSPRPKSKWGWQRVAFAPDGKRYAAHTGLEARVYDTATGFEPVRLDDQTDQRPDWIVGGITGQELCWSPDGKKVAAVGVQITGLGLNAKGAAVWDAETGNRLSFFPANLDIPQTLAFSADGKLLAATFKDRVVLYDAKTFKEVRNLGDQSAVTALAFSPDGKYLAAGIRLPIRPGGDVQDVRKWSYHTQVRLIDTETGKSVKAFDGFEGKDHPMEATKLPVTALAFSADGKKLIAGTGLTSVVPIYWGVVAHPNELPRTGEVKVWNLDGGKP